MVGNEHVGGTIKLCHLRSLIRQAPLVNFVKADKEEDGARENSDEAGDELSTMGMTFMPGGEKQ